MINLKKYISVFSLYIRSGIYKLIGLIALMALAQVLIFKNILNPVMVDEVVTQALLGIEYYIDRSKIIFIFGFTFLVLTVCLTVIGCEFGSKQGYTLRRLRISEKQITCCQALANTLMYTVFLVSELIVAFVLCRIYMNYALESNLADVTHINHQTIFLAFYRNDFLHSLLPLEDIIRHITNILSVIALGFTSAVFPYFLRRRRISLELFILIPFIVLNFTNNEPYFAIAACLIFIGIAMVRIGSEARAYD